jgi:hypothetical protein
MVKEPPSFGAFPTRRTYFTIAYLYHWGFWFPRGGCLCACGFCMLAAHSQGLTGTANGIPHGSHGDLCILAKKIQYSYAGCWGSTGFDKYIYESNLSDYTPVSQPKFTYSNLKSFSKKTFKDLVKKNVTNAYCYSINKVKYFNSKIRPVMDG